MRRRNLAVTGVATVVATILLFGCGGGDDGGVAEELAKQREIAAAKRQGARDATQSAKIKQLQNELKKRDKGKESVVVVGSSSDVPAQDSSTGVSSSSGDDWPGGSAYTAILASLGSEGEASSFQAEARADGLDAGILHSSNYSSLKPGYWVVFSGTYDSSERAGERASYAKSLGYSSAYPRFVSP